MVDQDGYKHAGERRQGRRRQDGSMNEREREQGERQGERRAGEKTTREIRPVMDNPLLQRPGASKYRFMYRLLGSGGPHGFCVQSHTSQIHHIHGIFESHTSHTYKVLKCGFF
jgi:hypothetical protein